MESSRQWENGMTIHGKLIEGRNYIDQNDLVAALYLASKQPECSLESVALFLSKFPNG